MDALKCCILYLSGSKMPFSHESWCPPFQPNIRPCSSLTILHIVLHSTDGIWKALWWKCITLLSRWQRCESSIGQFNNGLESSRSDFKFNFSFSRNLNIKKSNKPSTLILERVSGFHAPPCNLLGSVRAFDVLPSTVNPAWSSSSIFLFTRTMRGAELNVDFAFFHIHFSSVIMPRTFSTRYEQIVVTIFRSKRKFPFSGKCMQDGVCEPSLVSELIATKLRTCKMSHLDKGRERFALPRTILGPCGWWARQESVPIWQLSWDGVVEDVMNHCSRPRMRASTASNGIALNGGHLMASRINQEFQIFRYESERCILSNTPWFLVI